MIFGVFNSSRPLAPWIVLFAVFLLLPQQPVQAQDGPPPIRGEWVPYPEMNPTWYDCGLRAHDMDGTTRTHFHDGLRGPGANLTQTAEIIVDYGPGFTSEARTAFQRAVDIWEQHIVSPVTIRIDASFSDLGGNVLGGAGPSRIYLQDPDGDGTPNIYGDALIDALTGEDQTPGEPDIVAQFSSTRDDWNFADRDATQNEIDFTTVVLHEIGHGINYFDLLDYNSGTGQYGIDFDNNGTLDDDEKVPGVFERFIIQRDISGAESQLTDPASFPNPSTALGSALTSGRLFFKAPRSEEGAGTSSGPVPPKIYAPSTWQSGSSIAHLDENTYLPGDPNSLMSPRVGRGETQHMPGPIMCGQLADMGWELGGGCSQLFRDVFALSGTASASNGSVTLTWETSSDADIASYTIEQSQFGGPFEPVETLDGDAPPSVTLSNLGLGEFTFRLRWTRADGTEAQSFEEPTLTLDFADLQAESTAPSDLGRSDVTVSWLPPPGTQGITYDVEQAKGFDGDFATVATDLSSTDVTLPRQTPGTYRYRVTAKAQVGGTERTVLTRDVGPPLRIDFSGSVFFLGPYPNPTTGTATVELTAQNRQTARIEIFNSLGQRVFEAQRSLGQQAATRLTLNTQRWASGMYFIRVTGSDFTETEQFVVL